MTQYLRAPGNGCGVVNLQVQGAPGNWSEVMTFTSKGQGWNSTICKSLTTDTLKNIQELAAKVESCRRDASTQLEDQCIDLGIIYVNNIESLCSS